ncbi:FAD/NAD(P)-binding protein [Patescibacteria group bacterium]|nr:FAD/NAD(P)-binding protein [Patescibacteria group bacterium]
MINPYLPYQAKIIKCQKETEDVKLFHLKFTDSARQKRFHFWNGQFVQVGIPGKGEAPINICSQSKDSTKYFELAIREVGQLTKAFHQLKAGDYVYVRGPFGNGWPKMKNLPKKNLLLVGGGCGFIPLKSTAEELSKGYGKKYQVQILYGTSDESQLLFKKQYKAWQKAGIELDLIFDKKRPQHKTVQGAKCGFGLITKLFKTIKIVKDATAFICGPPIMFNFVVKELKKLRFGDEDIYLSLERRMTCGIGICQHCAIGDKYVCKDGPVFRYDQVNNLEL